MVWGGGLNSLLSHVLILSVILISLFSVSCAQPVLHTVKFNTNGGSYVPDQSVEDGKCAIEPAYPSKEGSTFSGWYKDELLTQEYDFNTPVKSDFTLYAKWASPKTTHTVLFDTLGGSLVAKQEVEHGGTAIEPEDPEKEGYIFLGWYSEIPYKNKYDFSTPVMADLTLYAKWQKHSGTTYKVKYTSGDGTGNPVEVNAYSGTYTLKYNTPSSSAHKAVEGDYTNFTNYDLSFLQWDIDGIKFYDGTDIELESAIEAEATWIDASDIGSFEGGIFMLNSSSKEVAVPRVITNEGNKLVESIMAEKFSGSVLHLPPSVEIIPDEAFRNCNSLKSVYFNTVEPPVVGDNAFPANVKFYVPEGADKSEYAEALGVSESNVKYSIERRTVTYDKNGATEGTAPIDTTKYLVGAKVVVLGKPDELAKTEGTKIYYFAGWNTEADGSGKLYIAGDKFEIREDTTLYAQWSFYLTFSVNSGTVSVTPSQYWNAGTKEYSTDNGATWQTYSGSSAVGGTSAIMFRGKDIPESGGIGSAVVDSTYYEWKITGTNVNCSGNIETILNYKAVEKGEHPKMAASCYKGMFRQQPIVTAPALPAMDLVDSCYRNMFRESKLTAVPKLPATNLAGSCYYTMFYLCTGLTTLPNDLLPATKMVGYCYNWMFAGCTGLTTLPKGLLPATDLAGYCYAVMFRDCTGLTELPSNLLPATNMVGECYQTMFAGCTGLTTLPDDLLPAGKKDGEAVVGSLNRKCYCSMFEGCTGLTMLPTNLLPATTLADRCYFNMFKDCTSLKTAPELPATTLADGCYKMMFQGCVSLKVQENGATLETKIFTCPDVTGKTEPVTDMFKNVSSSGSFTGTPTTGNAYYYY